MRNLANSLLLESYFIPDPHHSPILSATTQLVPISPLVHSFDFYIFMSFLNLFTLITCSTNLALFSQIPSESVLFQYNLSLNIRSHLSFKSEVIIQIILHLPSGTRTPSLQRLLHSITEKRSGNVPLATHVR